MRAASVQVPRIVLRGERITLRRPRLADACEFLVLTRKSASVYGAFAPPTKRKAQFEDYLRRCRRDDFCGFLICRNEDGVILWNINLFQIILRSLRSGVVGYFVGAPFSQQGYATEALQLVLQFAFKTVMLHRVEANIQPRNAASIALVKQAGFRCEGYSRRYLKIAGRWRDHERWAIPAEDWRTLQSL